MSHNHERDEWHREFFFSLFSGMLYGATSVVVGHPFDTIKTKMQAQSEYLTKAGSWNTLTTVIRKEGASGLYKGALSPFFGSMMYRALQFSIFEAWYTKLKDSPLFTKTIPFSHGVEYRVVFSWIVAGTVRAVIETPFEYTKIKRQTGQEWHFKNVYTGFWINWIRWWCLMNSYIFMLDILRRKAGVFDTKLAQFISSGTWATLAFLIVWPLETLKSLIQAETKNTGITWIDKSK